MVPCIEEGKPLPNFNLSVIFEAGKAVTYDVMDVIKQIASYRDLMTIHGLFNHVQLDKSRTCVF